VRSAFPPALVVALLVGCSARQVVSGRDLVEAPDRFDGRPIVLAGTVQDPRRRGPSADTGYTTFTLLDGSARVAIAVAGTLSVDAGERVEVRGVFREQLRVDGDLLVDTVEAKSVRPLGSAAGTPGTPVGPP
jgi:hypothetical protein